jgi:L-lactate dehydrogenase complex protein LldG
MPRPAIQQFTAQYEAQAGKVHLTTGITEVTAAMASILRETTAQRVALAGLPVEIESAIEYYCSTEGITVLKPPFARTSIPQLIDSAQVGISMATFGIASTGTLVEVATDDTFRLISTLPRVHVGLVRAADLVETLAEAAPLIRHFFTQHAQNCVVTFISGPSRSGDIEMRLTLGVHGPEVAHAIVLLEAS